MNVAIGKTKRRGMDAMYIAIYFSGSIGIDHGEMRGVRVALCSMKIGTSLDNLEGSRKSLYELGDIGTRRLVGT